MTYWLIHYAALPLVRGLRHVHHFANTVPLVRGFLG